VFFTASLPNPIHCLVQHTHYQFENSTIPGGPNLATMTNHHNGNGNVTYEVTDDDMKDQSLLHRTRTAGTISLSPEVFEKLYLNPQNKVVGHLRGKFGNPTPL
jgi:hypothetical protein